MESFKETLGSFAEAVLTALEEKQLLENSHGTSAIRIHERDDSCYRIVLHGASSKDSKSFSEAVWELFGPVQSHKYIIERRAHGKDLSQMTKEEILGEKEIPSTLLACHPVPSILGRRREFAEAFERAWNDKVAPGKIYYTRRGAGKEMVKKWFRKRAITVKREEKEVWE